MAGLSPLLLLLLLLFAHLLSSSASSSAKPNFVILFVDDMGIDQIQVPPAQRTYGYTGNNGTIHTPHISRLASEGLVFQTWYSAFHLCSPSRAAMMVSVPSASAVRLQ